MLRAENNGAWCSNMHRVRVVRCTSRSDPGSRSEEELRIAVIVLEMRKTVPFVFAKCRIQNDRDGLD